MGRVLIVQATSEPWRWTLRLAQVGLAAEASAGAAVSLHSLSAPGLLDIQDFVLLFVLLPSVGLAILVPLLSMRIRWAFWSTLMIQPVVGILLIGAAMLTWSEDRRHDFPSDQSPAYATLVGLIALAVFGLLLARGSRKAFARTRPPK